MAPGLGRSEELNLPQADVAIVATSNPTAVSVLPDTFYTSTKEKQPQDGRDAGFHAAK